MPEAIDIIFIITWLILPAFWVKSIAMADLSFKKPTLPIFTFIFIILFQYLGLPILYFQWDDYRAEFVTDKYLVFKILLITSLTITLMLAGHLIARYHFGKLNGFKNSQMISSANKFQYNILLALGILCIGILYNYLSIIGFDNIALFIALDWVKSIDKSLARSVMGNDFQGKYHWYQFFMHHLLSYVFTCLLAIYFLKPQKKTLITLILIGFFLSLSLIAATEKGPFINFLISCFLLHTLINQYYYKVELNLIKLFKIIAVIVLALMIFYVVFMGDSSWYAALWSIVSRTLTGSIQPAYHYLEFFPAVHDWLYGESLPNPGGIFSFTPYNLSFEIMQFMHPEHIQSGLIGSAPTVFWGELYANFSYYGVILISPVLGYALYALNKIIYKMSLNPFSIAFFTWALMHYKDLSITGLGGYIFDINLIALIIVVSILNFSDKKIIFR